MPSGSHPAAPGREPGRRPVSVPSMLEGEEMHEFDRATAVRRRHVDDDGRAVHEVDVDGGWAIGDKPNGGYLLATAARAAADAAAAVEGPEHPHAVAATAAYLAPPAAGPAEVHSEVLRRGRGTSQVRARLVQDGAVRVDATFTLGRLRPDATPWWGGAPAPEAPDLPRGRRTPSGGPGGVRLPIDERVAAARHDAPPGWGGAPAPDAPDPPRERRTPSDGPGGAHLPIMERVDIRLDPATAGFTVGRPSGTGELRAVLRFADGRAPDPLALLYAVDALPPAPFEVAGTTGWVPTITLTAYVRALPADGPLVVRQRAGLIEAGTVDEVCEVWDGRGRLVAQATQLAAIRTAGPPPA